MSYEFDGKTIEVTENGYLVNLEEWSEGLAAEIAKQDEIPELTDKHWDLINYLRSEYFEKNNQPNTRNIVKAMGEKWGQKIDTKALFELFPKGPDKQAGKIAGIPESRRKGGY